MGSVSVSSCRCCMFVSCVHPVAVLNAAFCMTCSLLMLVEDADRRPDKLNFFINLITDSNISRLPCIFSFCFLNLSHCILFCLFFYYPVQ